jgi:hypothetical protein
VDLGYPKSTANFKKIFNHEGQGDAVLFSGLVEGLVENRLIESGLVDKKVTTEVAKLLVNLKDIMTRQEIQEEMLLKNDEHFRKAYLKPAL